MQIARGKSLFVTVKQMAKARGKTISALTKDHNGRYQLGAWADDLVDVIRANGGLVKLVTGLKQIDEVVRVAQREGAPVIFAFKTAIKNADGSITQIKHSVIAMRQRGGQVKFADYGGKFFATLDDLLANLRPGSKRIQALNLMQKNASATVIGGTVDALARQIQIGNLRVLPGMEAIETDEDGVDLAFPATFVATNAPAQGDEALAEVVKESFDNFIRRKTGAPLKASKPKKAPIMMDPIHITAKAPAAGQRRDVLVMDPIEIKGQVRAPRPDWLTGVQFRLNHLGFGAGPVDGIMGPLTERAVRAFQRLHPPLAVDGIPGPRTQAKLAEVCGY